MIRLRKVDFRGSLRTMGEGMWAGYLIRLMDM